ELDRLPRGPVRGLRRVRLGGAMRAPAQRGQGERRGKQGPAKTSSVHVVAPRSSSSPGENDGRTFHYFAPVRSPPPSSPAGPTCRSPPASPGPASPPPP